MLNVVTNETYLLTVVAALVSACAFHYTRTVTFTKRCVHHKRIIAGKSDLNIFLATAMQPVVARYTPTWWANAHVQIFLSFFLPQACIQYKRDILILHDGGQTSLDWAIEDKDKHNLKDDSPIALLMHGITGCSDGLKSLCAEALENGYRPVVFHKRGHGGLQLSTPKLQAFGCVQDLKEAIAFIENAYPQAKLYGIGFSAGSALLCSYLGETGHDSHLEAAVLISPGYCAYDLFCRGQIQPFYDSLMTRNLKTFLLQHKQTLEHVIDLPRAMQAASVREFDEHVFVKMYGYSDLEAYWRENDPQRVSHKIQRPILCINALDDPVCTKETINYDQFATNPTAMLIETGEGSHCGFYEGHMFLKSWADRAALTYLNRLREYEQLEARAY